MSLSLRDSDTVRQAAGACVRLGTPGSHPSMPGCLASCELGPLSPCVVEASPGLLLASQGRGVQEG